MKKLILLIPVIILIALVSARAQYRYGQQRLIAQTNTVIAVGTNLYTGNADWVVDVGASTRADAQIQFQVHGTNSTQTVGFAMARSIDHSNTFDGFGFVCTAAGTNLFTTNLQIWTTNCAWLHCVALTNNNPGVLTNFSFRVGTKLGL